MCAFKPLKLVLFGQTFFIFFFMHFIPFCFHCLFPSSRFRTQSLQRTRALSQFRTPTQQLATRGTGRPVPARWSITRSTNSRFIAEKQTKFPLVVVADGGGLSRWIRWRPLLTPSSRSFVVFLCFSIILFQRGWHIDRIKKKNIKSSVAGVKSSTS